MNIPAELKYTENDEWIRVEGEIGTIGITDHAQDQLSDIVYVEVSLSEGDTAKAGDAFGAVESVKAASDVYLPITGEVVEINEALEDAPELINSDPYGDAWMIKVKITNVSELDKLMDAAGYEAYLQERDH